MNLEITEKAIEWFKDELEFNDDQALRFFVRYGGEFQLKQGFSPAFTVEELSSSDYHGRCATATITDCRKPQ